MVWYASDYDPKSLQRAQGRVRGAIDKKQPTLLDLKRKSVRTALLLLISEYAPSLATRTTVPQTALMKNNILIAGFARTGSSEKHWSNSESYNMHECDTFLKASEEKKLSLIWGTQITPVELLPDLTQGSEAAELVLMTTTRVTVENATYQFGTAEQTNTIHAA